jgi:hypothetical protein
MDKINYLYNAIVKHLNNKWIFHDDNETQVVINENNTKKLPYELVNIILEYDGRIKYKYKDKNAVDYHKFVNIIHKHDQRYNIITPIISKKHKIMMDTETRPSDTSFYFEFSFDNQPSLSLCYDYNWSYNNVFEICYTDMKGSGHIFGSDQIRTIYK